MKQAKRVLAMAMALTAVCGIAACGTPKKTGNPNLITVEASLAGYRRQWLDGIAEKYTQETGVEVDINWDPNLTTNISNVMDYNTRVSDLYYVNLSGGNREFTWHLQGKLEPLNDVFAKDNGTGITIEESIEDGFEGGGLYEGVRYAAYTVAGYDCLVYNPDILERAGWDKPFPATVDGLVEMFEVINNAQLLAEDGKTVVKPFVYTGIYDSISHLFDAFEVQYGGAEEYAAFYNQTDKSGPVEAKYYKKSTKVAFENLMKIMAVGNDNKPKYVLDGSAARTHTDAQTAFLNGYAAVCTTGTWFETEMGQIIEKGKDKYEIAPFPLATDENGGYGEAVNHLIDPTKEATPENMKKYNLRLSADSPFYIPKKAQNKEGAKDFLAFVLQEENIRYMHEQTGNALRYKYDRSKLNLAEGSWAKKVEANNAITISGVKGAATPLYLAGVFGGWQPGIWTRIASQKDFNIQGELNWRYNDVAKNWKDRLEVI